MVKIQRLDPGVALWRADVEHLPGCRKAEEPTGLQGSGKEISFDREHRTIGPVIKYPWVHPIDPAVYPTGSPFVVASWTIDPAVHPTGPPFVVVSRAGGKTGGWLLIESDYSTLAIDGNASVVARVFGSGEHHRAESLLLFVKLLQGAVINVTKRIPVRHDETVAAKVWAGVPNGTTGSQWTGLVREGYGDRRRVHGKVIPYLTGLVSSGEDKAAKARRNEPFDQNLRERTAANGGKGFRHGTHDAGKTGALAAGQDEDRDCP